MQKSQGEIFDIVTVDNNDKKVETLFKNDNCNYFLLGTTIFGSGYASAVC